MSLRKGRHKVTVRPVIEVKDQYGEAAQGLGDPVEVQCNVQPASATERESLGLVAETVYRIKYWPGEHGNVPWPGGAYSEVEWPPGRKWDQRGEALLSSMSDTTGHVKVMITAQDSEVR